jgi:hypothetical protein
MLENQDLSAVILPLNAMTLTAMLLGGGVNYSCSRIVIASMNRRWWRDEKETRPSRPGLTISALLLCLKLRLRKPG